LGEKKRERKKMTTSRVKLLGKEEFWDYSGEGGPLEHTILKTNIGGKRGPLTEEKLGAKGGEKASLAQGESKNCYPRANKGERRVSGRKRDNPTGKSTMHFLIGGKKVLLLANSKEGSILGEGGVLLEGRGVNYL